MSWDGISVEFLLKFVDGNEDAANFLSTDAVVERIVKPASSGLNTVLFDPEPKGKSIIESTHARYKGEFLYLPLHFDPNPANDSTCSPSYMFYFIRCTEHICVSRLAPDFFSQ